MVYISTWEALNENMIKAHMNLFGKKLCILGIYAISDDEIALVKEDFWGKLNKVIAEIGNSREILTAEQGKKLITLWLVHMEKKQ